MSNFVTVGRVKLILQVAACSPDFEATKSLEPENLAEGYFHVL